MNDTSDRTWELPKQPWIMQMTWSQLLFAHWVVDANVLADTIPRGLELDTHQGQAWIAIVPFLMSHVRPRCCPSVPGLSRFLELNVRTYVTCDHKPGVWFFSLDAASRFAVRAARATFHLPYTDARMWLHQEESQVMQYASQRIHRGEPPVQFEASYRAIGETFHALPGTLEHWLTARYCLYSNDRHGRIYRGEIDHDPWLLSPARCEIRTNTMCAPFDLDLSATPHLLSAHPVAVRAWPLVRCG